MTRWRWGGFLALLIFSLFLWLGWTVYSAYQGLSSARDNAVAAKSALITGDGDAARTHVDEAAKSADRALSATESPVWRVVSALPGVGSPLKVIEPLAAIVHDLTTDVLAPVVLVGGALNPAELRGADGRIDLASLRASAPALMQASDAATVLQERAQSLTQTTFVGQVNDAQTSLKAELVDVSSLLSNTAIAARVLPDMLGEVSPKSYFLAFQTNAESRGTGGLVGGFGIVDAVQGKVQLDELAKNSVLRMDYDPIDLGPEFFNAYRTFEPTSNWQNSNVSPHFPYAAQIWRSMWQQETGQLVDGVIATDPVALSYILRVTGPVAMADGEHITADNVVQVTQSDAYFRFADDNDARKNFLQDVAARVVSTVLATNASPTVLLDALGRGVSEGHTAVWSADPAIQAILSPTKISHEVPDDPAPYAALVLNNGAGGKLDYYLRRDIAYTAKPCGGVRRPSQITATITNTAPAQDYPVYVAGRQNSSTAYQGPPGTNRSVVEVFATTGAVLKKATLDGQPTLLLTAAERNHPIFYAPMVIQPGQTRTLVLDLEEPTAPGEARVPVQPQSLPSEKTVEVPTCG